MQSQVSTSGAGAWFQWTPLDPDPARKQIRLLVLSQGSLNDPIHCRLDHIDLHQSSPYEALSYEWGPIPKSPDDEPIIHINGSQKRVRQSLFNALLHIRQRGRERRIWIDALCINQADADDVARAEKKRCIMMMGDIYRGAGTVLVWLGLATSDSDKAIATINWIHEKFPAGEMRDVGFSHISPNLGSFGDGGEQQVSNAALETIVTLCQRSYWTRMWMIQELHLPAELEIHCGSSITTGAAFHSTFIYLYHQDAQRLQSDDPAHRLLQSIPFDFHFNYRQPAYKRDPRKLTFAFWIAQALTLGFECYKAHDVVYALRGQSYRVADDEVVPDYKKSLEVVFTDALIAWGTGNLEAEYGSGSFATREEAVRLANRLLGVRVNGVQQSWVEGNEERFEELYNSAQEEWWQRRMGGKCSFINKPWDDGLVGNEEVAARKKAREEAIARLRQERGR